MSDGTAQFDRMLNPGFCCVLSSALVEGACQAQGAAKPGISLVAVYLLLPMVLHQKTAAKIDKFAPGGLFEFVEHHPDLLMGLDRRIGITAANCRAGLAVAVRRGIIQFNPESQMVYATDVIKNLRENLHEWLVPNDAIRLSAATKLGRWISHISLGLLCDVLAIRPVWQNVATEVQPESIKIGVASEQ